jgi:hypothetical protein
MNHRAASRAVSQIASPKNCAASFGVFIIPRKRDKPLPASIKYTNTQNKLHRRGRPDNDPSGEFDPFPKRNKFAPSRNSIDRWQVLYAERGDAPWAVL